jgi:hypothetical protein
MSAATRRRPLPALAFLLVLSVLTAIVWWRVLHRANPDETAKAPAATVQPTGCTPGAKAVRLPTPASVTVRVLNGTNRDKLAAKVTSQLKSRGFTVGKPDSTSALAGVGEIQYGTAGRAGATLLRYYLPGAKLARVNRPDAGIVVVLGSGFQSLAPAATVDRAVAGASKPC